MDGVTALELALPQALVLSAYCHQAALRTMVMMMGLPLLLLPPQRRREAPLGQRLATTQVMQTTAPAQVATMTMKREHGARGRPRGGTQLCACA